MSTGEDAPRTLIIRSDLFMEDMAVKEHFDHAAQCWPSASVEFCVRLLLCSSVTHGVRIWGGSGEPLLALISVSSNPTTHLEEWTVEVQSTWCPMQSEDAKSIEALPTSPVNQRFVNDDALRLLQILWTAYPNAPCLCFDDKGELMRAAVVYRATERMLPLCPTAIATITNPMEGSPSLTWIPTKEWEATPAEHMMPDSTI
jgi:hypothetical protein